MKQFIPFEDDWDVLATLHPDDLVPYRAGMLNGVRSTESVAAPIRHAEPACESMPTALQSERRSSNEKLEA